MSADEHRVDLLGQRARVEQPQAERWLTRYEAAPVAAWRMLDEWLRTGSFSAEPLEGGHSLASLAETLPPLAAFDLVEMLLRAPRVGVRMVERTLREHGQRPVPGAAGE